MTVHIGSKIYTEYKKYTYTSWTQPKLTADGAMGGNSYACDAYPPIYSAGYEKYKAFDGNNSTFYASGQGSYPMHITFYSPVKLKVSSFKWVNRPSQTFGTPYKFSLQGSNTNSNWVTIQSYSNNNSTPGAQTTYNVTNQKEPYKYLRIYVTSGQSTTGLECAELTFTAQQVTGTTNGSASDYDYTVFHDGKIEDIYFGKTKIGKIYKGSTLVYASTVPDTDFLKQPDFARAVQFNQGQSYQADIDCWLCIGSNRTGANDPYLEICPDSSFGSNTVKVFMMTQRAGISYACGGTMIPLKKGWWYRSINLTTILLKIPCVATGGRVPYKHRNGLVKMPNYTTGVSVAQNTVMQAATDIWLYSRGSTRKIEVGKTSSTFTTIAEGVHSATEEPSTLVFIEKGLYYRTTGTDNRFFKCLE